MKNMSIAAAVFTLYAMSDTALADPAVFSDGVMTIPEGAVIAPEKSAYYSNIRLSAQENGSLVITAADKNPLVTIESMEIVTTEAPAVEVSLDVSGYLSTPCVELLPPAIAYNGNEITILLAESLLGPEETCIAVTEPFTTEISLAIDALPGDVIVIHINDWEAGFIYP